MNRIVEDCIMERVNSGLGAPGLQAEFPYIKLNWVGTYGIRNNPLAAPWRRRFLVNSNPMARFRIARLPVFDIRVVRTI